LLDTVSIHCHNSSVTAGWTLDELIAEAAVSLGGVEQGSSRVRDVPDQRTVRYYTTLGLVDGPETFRGKVGLYGERQLLQLVAIKRLQAQGETLAAIQARLLGRSTPRLRTLAGAPGESSPAPLPSRPAAARFQGVSVGDSVIVMVQPRRDLTREDVEAIEAASAPLLRLLRARHLVEDH
jgi:DNA-binding transcriptional MerR regulator